MKKYLIVDLSNTEVKEKAKTFARLIWKLYRPQYSEKDVTLRKWGTIKHPTLNFGAMEYDDTFVVPFNLYMVNDAGETVFKPRSVAIIESLIDLLYPNATASKQANIRTFVKNNSGATVETILPDSLPAGAELKTRSEMDAAGWFDYPE